MNFFEIPMYYLPVLYSGYLRKMLEEGRMVLKEKEKINRQLLRVLQYADKQLC